MDQKQRLPINSRPAPSLPPLNHLSQPISHQKSSLDVGGEKSCLRHSASTSYHPSSSSSSVPSTMSLLVRRCIHSCKSGISLRFTLVSVVLIPLLIGCILVWYIGYRTNASLVTHLSTHIRRVILTGIQHRIQSEFQKAMDAVQVLSNSVSQTTPNLRTEHSIEPNKHLFILFQQQMSVYMKHSWIANLMVSTTGGLTAFALRHMNFTMANQKTEIIGNPTIGPSDQHLDMVWADTNNFTWSQPPLNDSEWLKYNIYAPEPHQLAFDLVANMTKSFSTRLSVPLNGVPLAGFTAITKGLKDSNWTTKFNDPSYYAGSTKLIQISCIKTIFTANGSYAGWMATGMLLSLMDTTLQQLDFGERGRALILSSDGSLMSSSFLIPESVKFPTYINDPNTTRTNAFLHAIAERLYGMNLLSRTPTTKLDVSKYSLRGQHQEASLAVGGVSYHISAASIDISDLNWVICVITCDADWDGDVEKQNRYAIILTVIVVVVAAIVSLIIAHYFASPMNTIVNFMNDISSITTHQRLSSPGSLQSDDILLSNKQVFPAVHPLSTNPHANVAAILRISGAKSAVSKRHSAYNDLNFLCKKWHELYHSSGMDVEHDMDPTHISWNETEAPKDKKLEKKRLLFCQRRGPSKCVRYFNREVCQMERTFYAMLLRLRSSYQQLEAAHEARKHFIRYIFHEVRVPLNAMLLGIQHLKFQTIPPIHNEFTEIMDILHEQGNVVIGILNDVLCLQKIEEGKIELDLESFSVKNLCLSTLESFQAVFQEKQLTTSLQLHPDLVALFLPILRTSLPTIASRNGISLADVEILFAKQHFNNDLVESFINIVADRSRFRQVLSNFISNACKFTPAGGKISVLIEGTPLPETGVGSSLTRQRLKDINDLFFPTFCNSHILLRVSVTDTGCGMTDSDAATLFRDASLSTFVQVGTGAALETNKMSGSGLGLNICKKLIDLHEGYIGVHSKINAGSDFYFVIPSILGVNGSTLSSYIVSLYNQNEAQLLKLGSSAIPSHHDNLVDLSIHQNLHPPSPLSMVRFHAEKDMNDNELDGFDSCSEPGIAAALSNSTVTTSHQDPPWPPSSSSMSTRSFSSNPLNQHSSSFNVSGTPPSPLACSVYHILIVEDSLPNRKLLEMTLKRLRCRVSVANDGLAAVNLFKQYQENSHFVSNQPSHEFAHMDSSSAYPSSHSMSVQISQPIISTSVSYGDSACAPYDLILMDCNMPILNGLEATKQIRALGFSLPIVGLTGNALQEDVDEFLQAGANDVLTKPVAVEALKSTISNFLNQI